MTDSKQIDSMDKEQVNERTVDDIIERNFGQEVVGDKTENANEEVCDELSESENEESDESEPLTPEQLLELRNKVLALKETGNSSFRNGDFEQAIETYRTAAALCKPKELFPEKAILYSNRAASELKLGHAKPAIQSASRAIKYNPEYSKAYMRRAKAYDLEDKLDESVEDYKKVLELDPKSKDALEAMPDLERRINERNEKMKTEMMEKLKDLGNLVLRPFGLSTNNFQMAQDPNTGGYSINFKQN